VARLVVLPVTMPPGRAELHLHPGGRQRVRRHLTVTDKDGGFSTTEFTLSVTNAAPVVTLTATPHQPGGTPVTLAGLVSDAGTADTAAGLQLRLDRDEERRPVRSQRQRPIRPSPG